MTIGITAAAARLVLQRTTATAVTAQRPLSAVRLLQQTSSSTRLTAIMTYTPQRVPDRSFSSAAAATAEIIPEETTAAPNNKLRRRTIETKAPLVITETAAARIQELLAGESAQGAIGIRLGVRRRGCNGLSYTLNYAMEKPEKDLLMESQHGVKVFIEPMALFNVVGTVMDWEENELASEFTFNNPNSKGECGCGESFNV